MLSVVLKIQNFCKNKNKYCAKEVSCGHRGCIYWIRNTGKIITIYYNTTFFFNVSFCVLQSKENHTDLKQHKTLEHDKLDANLCSLE